MLACQKLNQQPEIGITKLTTDAFDIQSVYLQNLKSKKQRFEKIIDP